MAELYKVEPSKTLGKSEQVYQLLLESCDPNTRSLLRLTDVNIMPCGCPSEPTMTVACHSREIAEAIGLKHAYIKIILQQITGCEVVMAVHYKIPEGVVYFDTEGYVAPAKWYICNRKEFGRDRVPLPTSC